MTKREYGVGRTEQFNIRMTPEEKAALATVANRVGMTSNEYVRQVLNTSFVLAGIKSQSH